jgi:hypothetical protein
MQTQTSHAGYVVVQYGTHNLIGKYDGNLGARDHDHIVSYCNDCGACHCPHPSGDSDLFSPTSGVLHFRSALDDLNANVDALLDAIVLSQFILDMSTLIVFLLLLTPIILRLPSRCECSYFLPDTFVLTLHQLYPSCGVKHPPKDNTDHSTLLFHTPTEKLIYLSGLHVCSLRLSDNNVDADGAVAAISGDGERKSNVSA